MRARFPRRDGPSIPHFTPRHFIPALVLPEGRFRGQRPLQRLRPSRSSRSPVAESRAGARRPTAQHRHEDRPVRSMYVCRLATEIFLKPKINTSHFDSKNLGSGNRDHTKFLAGCAFFRPSTWPSEAWLWRLQCSVVSPVPESKRLSPGHCSREASFL